MWSNKTGVYVRLLTGLAIALATDGRYADQDFRMATVTLRSTITKASPPTLGLPSSRSSSDTFKSNQAGTTYETIPPGGPCAHSEFSCQLCKKEWCNPHDSRRRRATCYGFSAPPDGA